MIQLILLMQVLLLVQGKAFPHDRSHSEDNYGYYRPKEHVYDGYNYHYQPKPKYVLKYVVDGKEIIIPPVSNGHEMQNMYPNPYMPAPIVSDQVYYGPHYPHRDISHHDYHNVQNNPNIYVHHDDNRHQPNYPNYHTSQAVHIRPNVHNYNYAHDSSALSYESKNQKESDYMSDQANIRSEAEKNYYDEPVVVEALVKQEIPNDKYDGSKYDDYEEPVVIEALIKTDTSEKKYYENEATIKYANKGDYDNFIKKSEPSKTSTVYTNKLNYEVKEMSTQTIKLTEKTTVPTTAVKATTRTYQTTNLQVQTNSNGSISQIPPKQIEKVSLEEEHENHDGDEVDDNEDYEPEVIQSIILDTPENSTKDDELDYNDEMILVTQKSHVQKQKIDHNNKLTGVVIKKEIIIHRKHNDDDIDDSDYDEPEVSEVLVKVESQTQTIGNDDYDEPVVVETLIKTDKKHAEEDADYEEPQIVETLVNISKESFSTEDYEEPLVVEALVKIPIESSSTEDYEEPQVVEALLKVSPQSTSDDDYEKPQVVEALIKVNPESTSNEDYEEPQVVEALIKVNPESTSNEDYEEPQVVEELVKTPKSTSNEDYEKPNDVEVLVKSENSIDISIKEQVFQETHQVSTENTKLLKVDSLLVTKENEKGERIPIVNAIALKKPNEGEVSEIRVNAEGSNNDVHIINLKDLKLENKYNLNDEGSGEDIADVPGLGARNFLPVNPNIFTHVNRIPFQEMQKFKNCTTRNNEPGHCMPLQLCFAQNVAGTVDNILNNVCVIDEVFIGICCPEFPTETDQVDWSQSQDLTDVSTEIAESTECGTLPKELNEIGVWPWMALLVSGTQDKIFCGGALINSNYVVTAAHCTTRIPGNKIYIRLRSLDSTKVSNEEISVVQIKRHAFYNRRTKQNDIALLKLSKRVKFGEFRRPVCLPNADENLIGKTGIFLGWKRILEKRNVENLPVLPNQSCQQSLGVLVRESVLCAGPRTEEVMCNIDSGSPLILLKDQKYEMIGTLTWNRNDCDGRLPSMFTRVSNFTTWIQSHTT